jgi:hypothetical protein
MEEGRKRWRKIEEGGRRERAELGERIGKRRRENGGKGGRGLEGR